jgi:hypothetical protein
VTGFGALLGFLGITRPIPARPAEPEVRTLREPAEQEAGRAG